MRVVVRREMYRYAPVSEQPKLGRSLSELSAAERAICERMLNTDFLEKLLDLLALEEEKGKDRFHPDNFAFFKVRFCLQESFGLRAT